MGLPALCLVHGVPSGAIERILGQWWQLGNPG